MFRNQKTLIQPEVRIYHDDRFLKNADLSAEKKSALHLFELRNENGMCARICNYGATLISLEVPDRNGDFDDVVLGFDDLKAYMEQSCYIGASIGPIANRIASASFSLNGKIVELKANEGRNCLHSASAGLNQRIWNLVSMNPQELILACTVSKGEAGYPATVHFTLTVRLTGDNSLEFYYRARSEAEAFVNLTNHSYFNLNPAGKHVLGHELCIHADRYTEVDAANIPTGRLPEVKGGFFDFLQPKEIGRDLDPMWLQLAQTGQENAKTRDAGAAPAYDHSYVVNGSGLRELATAYEPISGRRLRLISDRPCVQFYAGRYLNHLSGRSDSTYDPFAGFCLEAQDFVDAPNQPDFPFHVLSPGECYQNRVIFAFSCE